MIPLKLVLKNFLSYRYINLDFTGLHTACICGANGSGKSSLLEAITWSLWGQSRVSNADDIIYTGAKDVRVDFTFQINQDVYRVIRMRPRQKSGSLELQISNNHSLEEKSFKSLSSKKIADTQKEINKCVKIDYQTFINSAYLRQGKADEFMLKTSSQRKEVLAELLK
ncbi:MAG TPA: AAA family ATPase, partial [Allocoleopsis sp.]